MLDVKAPRGWRPQRHRGPADARLYSTNLSPIMHDVIRIAHTSVSIVHTVHARAHASGGRDLLRVLHFGTYRNVSTKRRSQILRSHQANRRRLSSAAVRAIVMSQSIACISRGRHGDNGTHT